MRQRRALVLVCVLIAPLAFAGDPQAGQQKSAPCQACHGADGNSTGPQFPRLAGQYPDYLVQALMEYKNGERKNPIMAPFAAQLSPRDMEDLAAYFSTRPNGLFQRP
ncbi:MAG: c-type cytochrome [Sulfurifustaceae bacterium]